MNILSLHYLPCVSWFQYLLHADCVVDVHEHYVKQSYRNRCVILSANGPLSLTIPVKKDKPKETVAGMQIENEFPWQKQHWQAITSAYRRSPYFEHYEHRFAPFYLQKQTSLLEFNSGLVRLILELMRTDRTLTLSTSYLEGNANDLRGKIHPKQLPEGNFKPYLQVFSEKFPFQENLSMIDALFNLGPQTGTVV